MNLESEKYVWTLDRLCDPTRSSVIVLSLLLKALGMAYAFRSGGPCSDDATLEKLLGVVEMEKRPAQRRTNQETLPWKGLCWGLIGPIPRSRIKETQVV